MRTHWAGRPLVLKATTGSTNDDVRAAASAAAPTGYTVVADAQSAGRGRRGRVWHSPAGANLYLSLLARPALSALDAPVMALAAALAVRDAVATVVDPDRVAIKWPNDVRVGGRKVAGVLVEGVVRGNDLAAAVIGVGLNVAAQQFPPDVASRATSVAECAGRPVDRAALLEALLFALEGRIDALVAQGRRATVDAVARVCDTLGARVRAEGAEGVADGLSEAGGLWVRTDDGSRIEVRAGEVLPVDGS